MQLVTAAKELIVLEQVIAVVVHKKKSVLSVNGRATSCSPEYPCTITYTKEVITTFTIWCSSCTVQCTPIYAFIMHNPEHNMYDGGLWAHGGFCPQCGHWNVKRDASYAWMACTNCNGIRNEEGSILYP